MVEIGNHVKVFLKGESPWAIVTKIIDKSHIEAKIDNHPISDLHKLQFGDIASFELREIAKGYPSWEHDLYQPLEPTPKTARLS
jgi:hypothetical protein